MNDLKELRLSRMKAKEYQDEAERNRLLAQVLRRQVPRRGPRWLLARSLVRLATWLSPAHSSAPPQPASQRTPSQRHVRL